MQPLRKDNEQLSSSSLSSYSMWECSLEENSILKKNIYLKNKPKLVSIFHIFLVVHAIEFDYIGMIRESFQNVVLSFNFFINILVSQMRNTKQKIISIKKKKGKTFRLFKLSLK